MCYSSVLGVDIGSDYLRAVLIGNGQRIRILGGDEEEDKFPTILTVVPSASEIPDAINASNLSNFTFLFNDILAQKKYPNSTIRLSASLMGKVADDGIFELMKSRRLWGNTSLYRDGRVMVAGLLPETPIHRAFMKINASVVGLGDDEKTDSLTIVVPKYYPQLERDSLRVMAKAVNYKPFIVDSSRALGSWFAYNNRNLFAKSKIGVVFFVFGATNLQITFNEFSKLENDTVEISEKSYEFDDTVGGHDIDVLIADFIASQFEYKITPRTEQLLLLEAQSIKKKLTSMKRVNGSIESLDGEHDLHYVIDESDYQKILRPILAKVENCSKRFMKSVKGKIDRVMFIGGSSRIQHIQDLAKKMFSTNQIYTSMLKDEMLALAAAFIGASMSKQYSMMDIIYNPLSIYKIELLTPKALIPFNGVLPYPNSKYWLQQTGKIFPIGSSIFMTWNIAGNNTAMRQTKDGLWRFVKPRLKHYHVWKTLLVRVATAIEAQETDRVELQKLVNDMENLIYESKSILDDKCDFIKDNEKKILKNAIELTERWFKYQKKYQKQSLLYRISLLNDAVSTVLCRGQNKYFLQEAIDNMTKAFGFIDKSLKKWSLRKIKPPRDDIRSLLRLVASTKLWYDELRPRQLAITKYDNPILSWQAIKSKTDEIITFAMNINEEIEDAYNNEKSKKRNG